MKEFTYDKYNDIKRILKENKISSKDLDMYIKLKAIRYRNHKEDLKLTDEEMLKEVNKKEGA